MSRHGPITAPQATVRDKDGNAAVIMFAEVAEWAKVAQPLIVRIAVDGRHESFLHAKGIVENLHERRKTVGRTGCIGKNFLLFLIFFYKIGDV